MKNVRNEDGERYMEGQGAIRCPRRGGGGVENGEKDGRTIGGKED